MLLATYYAQNYAGIISWFLAMAVLPCVRNPYKNNAMPSNGYTRVCLLFIVVVDWTGSNADMPRGPAQLLQELLII